MLNKISWNYRFWWNFTDFSVMMNYPELSCCWFCWLSSPVDLWFANFAVIQFLSMFIYYNNIHRSLNWHLHHDQLKSMQNVLHEFFTLHITYLNAFHQKRLFTLYVLQAVISQGLYPIVWSGSSWAYNRSSDNTNENTFH